MCPVLELQSKFCKLPMRSTAISYAPSSVCISRSLTDVVAAIKLSRTTLGKIKQNLFWAFGYNTALFPVAAGALIPLYGVTVYSFLPFLAGAAMAGSSVTVVGNSLLLARWRLRDGAGVADGASRGGEEPRVG